MQALETLKSRIKQLKLKLNFNSGDYWEHRYAQGGDSGGGSYGEQSESKAKILNGLIEELSIKSCMEFGCGDGNQLKLYQIPQYIGLDVSRTILQRSARLFENDKTKSFYLYDPQAFVDHAGLFRAEATLSIDVIFHLVEDEVYFPYLKQLFECSQHYVIISSSDHEENETSSRHVRHRKFTQDVQEQFPQWKLIRVLENQTKTAKYDSFHLFEKQ